MTTFHDGASYVFSATDAAFQATLTRMERTMSRVRDTIQRAAALAGKALAALGFAAAAGFGMAMRSAQETAREITNLSRVAGISTAAFQEMAYGAAAFGVEQDKLSDILKDVNDKMGDFLVTGQGPFVDYFKQIAPLIGQTADEFRGLSSAEVLGKYVAGLEEANVSQAQMTFFMEAIASDATALIPLLANGGAALQEYADKAAQLGLAMSDDDIARLNQARAAWGRVRDIVAAFLDKVMARFAPLLTVVAQKFEDTALAAGGMSNVADTAMDTMVSGAGRAADAYAALGRVIDGLRVIASVVGRAFYSMVATVTDLISGLLGGIETGINSVIRGVNNLPSSILDKIGGPIGEISLGSDIMGGKAETLAARATELANMGAQAVREIALSLSEPLPSESINAAIANATSQTEALREAYADLFDRPTVNGAGGVDGGGSDGSASGPNEFDQEAATARLEALQLEYATEREALAMHLQEKQDLLREFRDQGIHDAQTLNDLERTIMEQHEQDLTDITRKENEARNAERLKAVEFVGDSMSKIAGALSSGGKAAFQIQKAQAIATAALEAKSSVLAAYKWGSKYGPAAAAGAAALAGAASLAMAADIAGSSYSGGGGASSAAAGGAAGGSAAISQAAVAQEQTMSKTINVVVEGASAGMLTFGSSIADMLNQELENGAQINGITIGGA